MANNFNAFYKMMQNLYIFRLCAIRSVMIFHTFPIVLYIGLFVAVQSVHILHVTRETKFQSEVRGGIAQANLKSGAQCQLSQISMINDGANNMNNLCKLHKPDVILDTTRVNADADPVKRYSRCLAVPTVSSSIGSSADLDEWKDLNASETNYLVHIRRPTDIMQYLIMAITEHTSFDNVVILYDNNYSMDYMITTLFRNKWIRHVVVKLDGINLKHAMKKFISDFMYTFFLFGSNFWVQRMIRLAEQRYCTGVNYAWYFVTHDTAEITCKCKNITIIHIRPLINETNEAASKIANNVDFGAISNLFHYDLAIATCLAAEIALKNKLPAKVDCKSYNTLPKFDAYLSQELLKLNNQLNGKRFHRAAISELHQPFQMEIRGVHIENSVVTKAVPLGTWSSLEPLQLKLNKRFYDYPAKVYLKIAIVIKAPFIFPNKSAPRGYSGYCIDLIDIMSERMQFQYELYVPLARSNLDTEKHDAVIRDVRNRKADLGLGSLSITAREVSVMCSFPIYDLVGYSILMKRPQSSTSFLLLLFVLDYNVWGAIFATYCFASYQRGNNPERRMFTLNECFWFCMTSLTPYGGGEAPGCASGRILAGAWWLFGCLITAVYTANLSAFLTMSQLRVPIESLDDLISQSDIHYGVLNGSSVFEFFENMAWVENHLYKDWQSKTVMRPRCANCYNFELPIDGRYTKIMKSLTKDAIVDSVEEAVKKVQASPSLSEGFAYIGDATDIRYAILTNCDLQIVGPEFSKKRYSIVFNRQSYLIRKFNDMILNLLNERILEQLKKKWWNQNPLKADCNRLPAGMEGVSLENVVGIFIFIAAGTVFAMMLRILEILYKCLKKNNRIGANN